MRAQALRRAGPWRYLAPHADGATTCSPPAPLLSGSSPIKHQRTNAYQPVHRPAELPLNSLRLVASRMSLGCSSPSPSGTIKATVISGNVLR